MAKCLQIRNFETFSRKLPFLTTSWTWQRRYSTLQEGSKQYDLVVIGGGSGGLACSKEASVCGRNVAVLDYVDPSPRGTKWGLGGTCVNVGCIPKKLMHHAALLGRAVTDAKKYGWNVADKSTNNWKVLSSGVRGYVKSLNWGHRVQLRDKKVDYVNGKGFIRDKNTVVATIQSKGEPKEVILKTDNIVIATGMRPSYPDDIVGAAEHAISSDDIFWMEKPPGKTLCIGASYVSLEIAGFLAGLGFDVSVAIRSRPLRMFDQEMASLVVKELEHDGVRILMGCTPKAIEKVGKSDRLQVSWVNGDGQTKSDNFDTVLLAVGRVPVTQNLGLSEVGVKMDKAGYIIGNHGGDLERSSVSNIFAIGDVLKGYPELTPVAIKAGKLLAQRLFNNSRIHMDYHMVPSTVFTPIEYSFVGLSEEAAVEEYGPDEIEVYHAFYKPLEFTVADRKYNSCYIKVIVERTTDRVLGLHFTGPNAGELMQGYAVALRCGLTLERLTSTVGIHPTCSEEIVKLHITKRSGLDATVTGC